MHNAEIAILHLSIYFQALTCGKMVNFSAVEPPFSVDRFSNANHGEIFSTMVSDSRRKTQTFPTLDFKDHSIDHDHR